ncbi:hypothetical protein CL633_01075 [bacterium]|nr:hypothetical protein [bacterium]
MKIYFTDCEGPISLNDNAQELAEFFIPNGADSFAKISKYDDYLADIEKKPGYMPGMTLRLILPFLKAYGATDKKIQKYCAENVALVPGARKTLTYIYNLMPIHIISTSYEYYVRAVCDEIGIDMRYASCTNLSLDAFNINPRELISLKNIYSEISDMPIIDLPDGAELFEDLSTQTKISIVRLNNIFWREIAKMASSDMYLNKTVIGGKKKANIIIKKAKSLGIELPNVMYVGDSITDAQALKIAGISVSFNGNHYAIESSDIAVISKNTLVMRDLAMAFKKNGKDTVLDLVDSLESAHIITSENKFELIEKSLAMRKKIRGKAGALG